MSEVTVPYGWNEDKLQFHCEKITDGSHTSPPTVEGGLPIATVENMRERTIDIGGCREIGRDDFTKLVKGSCSPQFGDVLFSKDGTVGKTFVFNQKEKIVLLSSIAIIRTKKSSLSPDYLTQYLSSPFFYRSIENVKSGSAIKRVVLTDIKNLKLPIPPLPEQQKIASILTSVDDVIEKTQSQINKLQDLKKGTMNELLTRGIGHTEYVDSPVGKIPRGWEVRTMDSLTVLMTNGFVGSAAKHYREKGVPYLRSTNVRSNRLQVNDLIFISEEFHKESSRSKLQTGDLLTVQSGHIGTSAVVTEEFNGTNCHALIVSRFVKDKISSKFIAYYFNSDIGMGRLSGIFVGSTIKHINTKDLKKFEVIVPPLSEQEKIASILTSIDKNIEEKQRKLEQTKSLKKSLMQDLLTGKVRVPLQ